MLTNLNGKLPILVVFYENILKFYCKSKLIG